MTRKNSIFFIFAFLSFNLLAQSPVPDFWESKNCVGGAWVFGRVPYACDINPFMTEESVLQTYAPAIFDDTVSRVMETQRYIRSLYTIIRDAAKLYISERKPNVDSEEISAFGHAIFALANHETRWSHYRKAAQDGRIKFVRGDSGHGHGIMQIDDRWHFIDIKKGVGHNLLMNIVYGMEEYFYAWEKAPSANCIQETKSWRNRTMSAYSAYNGGISQLCRWTNPSNPWARNDQGFADKYDHPSWKNYIIDFNAPAPIDVAEIMDGNP